MSTRFFTFVGGSTGTWLVRSQSPVVGDPIPAVERLEVVAGSVTAPQAGWSLRGITSNERYVERSEKLDLVTKQQSLGRDESTYAALIPIRKTPHWWALTQDDRRDVFERQSQHIRTGLKYLPPIARRLHHCRDVSESEPFDFLTWFEYAPCHEPAFEALLLELRASPEWRYVDWEVDIRLAKSAA